jgi:HK97 gp10 family phage protein
MSQFDISLVVNFNNIPQLSNRAQMAAEQVVAETAQNIEAHARTIVPVDTGRLRASIATTRDAPLQASIGPRGVEYCVYVEYGTYKSRAQPYMRPAAEQARAPFIAAMSRIVQP